MKNVVRSAEYRAEDESSLPQCPICGAREGEGGYEITDLGMNVMLACRCGLMSKPFNNTDDLITWWRTRGGRKPPKSYIKIKHNSRVEIPKSGDIVPVSRTGDPDPF